MSTGIHLGPSYEAKAKLFRESGTSKLQVVSDFDQTLTTYIGKDGKPGDQCHDVLVFRLPSDEEVARPGLADALVPIREWMIMTEEEHMVLCEGSQEIRRQKTFWFNDTFQQICSTYRLWEVASGCVQCCNTCVRPGLAHMFSWLETHAVPLLVVSAGIKQVIEPVLDSNGAKLPSTAVLLANDLHEGKARVTKRTKSSAFEAVPEYRQLVRDRTCVLLLGDKDSDCKAADGAGKDCEVLRVGFMEGSPTPEALEEYLRHFDVALSGDASMDFVNSLLQSVSNGVA
eukprot:gnl/TRDRNA2_/TRDRNA2_80642_c0_seq1.p1 gnl/TRDRNA2_/TRDRNA2_80642_c0~~gnl/TRDRNA2_/TRDRNA2_80642_c0_seq1.p1  ORF type:complete len:286 (+),score=48.78 gnl/TRDRNA2_/TRDRNA2_80642_c0_seq1:33-890(+)